MDSEDRAAAILNTISDGYYALDREWRFTFLNRAGEQLLGRRREDLLGQVLWTAYPGFEDTDFGRAYRAAMQDQQKRILTAFYPPHKRWYEVHVHPAADLLTVYFHDVSERVRTEQTIRETAERYRSLFDSIDEGFCIIDMIFDKTGRPLDYRFVEVNPAFERHTGMANATGRRMREIVPEHESSWFEIYGKVARTGESVRFVNHAEALGRWFDVYAFRLGGDGSTKVAVLFNDITARRRMEEALVESEQRFRTLALQLAEADKRKDEFLAVLAHELRNPLAPLRNGLQIMRLAPNDAAAIARTRDVMERQLGHMVHLLDDLLDVARIGAAKLELRRSHVALSDIIHSAIETARPAIETAGHRLHCSMPKEPLLLDADLTRLSQVVSNLLNNSAKYTSPGGEIRLTAGREGEEIVITVEDTGIGIPPDQLQAVFGMFTQVDRSTERDSGGLGIGLALVKGLVELHGGSVKAESEGDNLGSRFTVRLPMLPQAARAPDPIAEVPRQSDGKLRILVVDDNRDAASSTALVLSLIGYETQIANDGPSAIETAQSMRPDAILMDIGMPAMNGHEVTRRIRAEAWGKETFIVALTGWGQESDRRQSKAAGCNAHMVKPVNLPELEALLETRH